MCLADLTAQPSLECGGPEAQALGIFNLTPLSFADGVRACRSPRIDSRLRSAGKQSGAGAPHRRGTRGLDPSSPPQRAAEIKSGVEPPHSTDRSRSATRNLSRSNRKLSNADLCQTPGPGREPWDRSATPKTRVLKVMDPGPAGRRGTTETYSFSVSSCSDRGSPGESLRPALPSVPCLA